MKEFFQGRTQENKWEKLNIEIVAESLGVVALFIEKPYNTTQMDALVVQKRKWT